MRPFLVLLAIMLVLTVADLATSRLADSYLELIRFGRWEWQLDAGFFVVLGFALGSGLIAREQEEGTQAFLDGLPVRRRTVFLAKLGIAVACIFLYSIIAPLLAWGFVQLVRRSVDVPVELSALAALLARYALLSAWAVALGLVCGFMRQMAWLLFGLLALALGVVERIWPRVGAALNPTGLVAEGWATRGWDGDVLPVSALATLLLLALAYLLFASAGGARMGRLAALAQHRVLAYGLYAAAAALFAVFALLSTQDGLADSAADDSGAAQQIAAPASKGARRIQTAHYRFSVPPGTKVAADLAARADAAFRHGAEVLGIDPAQPGRIDVDLSGSVQHTAGIAALDRIRMNPDGDWFDTLTHETLHVLAARLAGAERNRELDKMALFNEGLAYWAEPGRQRDPALRARDDLAAAILMRRRQLSGEVLLADGGIERNLDWEMKYPLGALLIDTMVARYGKHAPARVLQTLARADFPRDQEDAALYRSAFQLAGFDLNLVLFDYAERLRQLAQQHAPLIDALPRARGLLVTDGARVGIALKLDRPLAAGHTLHLRFRPKDSSAVHEYTVVERLERRGALPIGWLARDRVAGNEVCFQGGVGAHGRISYEPWDCLPMRAAAPHAPGPARNKQ